MAQNWRGGIIVLVGLEVRLFGFVLCICYDFICRFVSISMVFLNKYLLSSKDYKVARTNVPGYMFLKT